jgi:protein-S-isoprenylcysteine O-methyltransferase Ste14
MIFAASLGLLVWAVSAFRRHETTVDPLAPERASQLVSDGPFLLTRNPMYVAMAGVLVANAVARRSTLGMLPAAGFVLLIDKAQIEAEERVMAGKFGAEWVRYVATTPRWLSPRSFPGRKPSA